MGIRRKAQRRALKQALREEELAWEGEMMGLGEVEYGLGRFGDRRLEKGGRRCMPPW